MRLRGKRPIMTLRAGTAVRDVTPRKPTFLVGYPHVERTSTGVHDPLLASALCLREESAALLMVAVDILQIDPPTARRLRAKIARRTGIPQEGVFVSCTHTHSGPATMKMIAWQDDPVVPDPDPDYLALLCDGIAEAAAEAAAKTEEAEIACTVVPVRGVGANRHSPDGPADPEAGALLVRKAGDKTPIAASVVYSMHPTVLHEDSTLVSADFPAYTRQHLREALGENVVVLYHTGPCGNQSPRYSVSGQTFSEAERLGRILGSAVLEAIGRLAAGDFKREVTLAGRIASVELPRRTMPSVAEARKKLRECTAAYERLRRENAGHGPVRTAECAVFGAEESVFLARCHESGELAWRVQAYTPAEVQVLRIADAYVAGLPGEVFVEYGLMLKEKSPARTFVVSLVNGDLQGYIVTPEAAAAGGYEAANSLFSHESGEIMASAALRLIADLARDA